MSGQGELIWEEIAGRTSAAELAASHPFSFLSYEEADVVLRRASVSKLHAHFRYEDGALTLTDVGSHNGTRIDGTVLVPHRPSLVPIGAVILFGRVSARVFGATGAHELLRRR